MKRLLIPLLLLGGSSLAADQPSVPCNLNDGNSVCVLRISVSDLAAIDSVLESAPTPHKTWGVAWDRIMAQLRAQQPQSVSTREPQK